MLWPLGVSYIDDHVLIRKMPLYLGKLLSINENRCLALCMNWRY